MQIACRNRRTIGERDLSDRCIGRLAQPQISCFAINRYRMAKPAHSHAQYDVDHIVTWSTPVREAGEVVTHYAKAALRCPCGRRDRSIEPGHFRSCDSRLLIERLDPGQERRHQILAGKIARRQIGNICPERGVYRSTEKRVEERRERWICHEIRQCAILRRLSVIEDVLLVEADDQFIHQGHTETRHLNESTAVERGPLIRRGRIIDACLRQT